MLYSGRSFILLILKCVLTLLLLSVPTASDSAEAPSVAGTLEATELRGYFLAIDSAHRLWLAGDIERAEQLLHETPPDLRGWEYQYLDRLFHSEKYDWVAQRWDGRGVRHVTFSPDGKLLAAACSDLTVKIWKVATGELAQHLQQETKTVDFSPDGRLLAGGVGNTVTIWDVQTGAPVNRLSPRSGVAGVPHRVQYSPEGGHILTTDTESGVRVWDVVQGKSVMVSKQGEQAFALAPDGRQVAVVRCEWVEQRRTGQTRVMFVDLVTGKPTKGPKLETPIGYSISDVVISPDGRLVAAAAYLTWPRGEILVWDRQSGERLHRLRRHDHHVALP